MKVKTRHVRVVGCETITKHEWNAGMISPLCRPTCCFIIGLRSIMSSLWIDTRALSFYFTLDSMLWFFCRIMSLIRVKTWLGESCVAYGCVCSSPVECTNVPPCELNGSIYSACEARANNLPASGSSFDSSSVQLWICAAAANSNNVKHAHNSS